MLRNNNIFGEKGKKCYIYRRPLHRRKAEGWQSGLSRRTRNAVGGNPSQVRILYPPLSYGVKTNKSVGSPPAGPGGQEIPPLPQ